MTQEEKAKAYDEALEKAKIEINTKGIGETVNLCEQLFPELRENEDESLKNKSGYYKAGKFWKASTLWNATRNKVPQRVSNRYILQECTWNIGNLQDFANEVKNVQEVSLDYPIILDMNGNILDGAHRVVKAYLEGKDIDIVYLGDDEWPEPDYDEEKAVRGNDDERIKKSLIKFLTDIKEISESGRTSWAVRKEDAEMCKSFLAWLEKQKEKLGDISTILLVKKEIERRIETWQKSRKELIAMECNTLADDAAVRIEELYSLISFLGTIRCNTNEKQKEQKDYRKLYEDIAQSEWFKKAYAGKSLGEEFEQKEQRPVERSLEDDHIIGFVYDLLNEIKWKDNWAMSKEECLRLLSNYSPQKITRVTINGEPIPTENHSVNIPLAEWSEEDAQKLVPFSCGHENGQPAEKQDYSELNDLERAILRGFLAAGVENVPIGIIKDTASECVGFLALTESEPVEWSEEDEGELQNAIDALEFLGKKGVYRSESGYDAALQAASWLKSLSERFNLQRKVEWSEEDKKMLNHLIDKIQENWHIRMPGGHYFGISNDEKETFSSWLRCLPERFNLSPKQEWSEKDEAAYNAFICEVINEKMNPTIEQVKWLRSICDRLKFLHPQPKAEWSEEDESSLKELIHYFESLLDCLATEKRHAENRKWLKFLKSLRPQSKQEWNNEDESILKTIITDVGFVQRKCGIGTDEWYVRSKAIQWLKNLLERFNPPKQEWKEVELEFRGEKVKIKRPFFRDDKGREYSTTEQDEDVAWYALRAWCDKKGISLYDLYPKNEWSEEDEEMLEYVIGDVNDAKQLFTTKEAIDLCDKEIAWLKSLRPQYHGDVTMTEAYKMGFEAGKASSWKPSEEQMDSLRDTIANTKGYSYSIYLPELYEQLKKLV